MSQAKNNPEAQAEVTNMKFAGLTAALGLVATFGSEAIPEYNQSLQHLRASVAVGGVVIVMKGLLQGLDALNKYDDLTSQDSDS